MRLKELFEVVKSFAEVQEVAQKVDWLECFKFALEQYGIENANLFLKAENDSTSATEESSAKQNTPHNPNK